MFCVECGNELPPQAKFCSACGTQVVVAAVRRSNVIPSEPHSDAVSQALPSSARAAIPVAGSQGIHAPSFSGKGSDVFSWNGFKAVLAFVSILGMPFGLLLVFRWLFRHVALPSGARLSFIGTVGQAYKWMLIVGGASLLNRIDPFTAEGFEDLGALGLVLVLGWTFVV
jgi:hypothetical protein